MYARDVLYFVDMCSVLAAMENSNFDEQRIWKNTGAGIKEE